MAHGTAFKYGDQNVAILNIPYKAWIIISEIYPGKKQYQTVINDIANVEIIRSFFVLNLSARIPLIG